MKIEQNSVLSLGREQVFRNFIGPPGLRGGGAANPLLPSAARSALPDAS